MPVGGAFVIRRAPWSSDRPLPHTCTRFRSALGLTTLALRVRHTVHSLNAPSLNGGVLTSGWPRCASPAEAGGG